MESVALTTSQCDEGTARYVSVGESSRFTGQVCGPFSIQEILVQIYTQTDKYWI